MKYLRPYRIFEDIDDVGDEEFNDAVNKVNDILSYLTDEGFSTKVYIHNKTRPLTFAVEINRMDIPTGGGNALRHNEFNINDIKEEVVEFVNQMSDEYQFLYFYKAYYQCKEYWYEQKVSGCVTTSKDINDLFKNDELLIDFVKLEFKKK